MLNTKQKGSATELHCMAAFADLGYECYVPHGEDSRYDFIADVDGKLIRVQSKTSQLSEDGSVANFSCRSTRVNSRGVYFRQYNKDEIDYFCTYFNRKCYLIPVEDCGSSAKQLRITPPKSNQQKAINYASDYELSNQIQKILNKN